MSKEKGFVPERFGREALPEEQKVEERKEEIKSVAAQIREAKKRDDFEEVEKLKAETKGGVKKERHDAIEALQEHLYDVEDLETDRIITDKEGKEHHQNVRNEAIETYYSHINNLTACKKAFHSAQDQTEKKHWQQQFAIEKKKLDKFLNEDPKELPSFEKALLEWTRTKREYARFLGKEIKLTNIKKKLAQPAFSGNTKELSNKEIARLERMSRKQQAEVDLTVDEQIAHLNLLFSETDLKDQINKAEYDRLVQEIRETAEGNEAPKKKSKAELEQEAVRTEKELDRDWQDLMIRRHEGERQLQKLFNELARGQRVLEMPSTIHYLNRLKKWEREHPNTTIGGVLVGPPGTGKTTLVDHHLKTQDPPRSMAPIDCTEELTWYFLWGSKEMTHEPKLDYYRRLENSFENINEENFIEFIKNNAEKLREKYGFMDEKESEKNTLLRLFDEVSKLKSVAGQEEKAKELKARLQKIAQNKFSEQLVDETMKTLSSSTNGWRDGLVLSALRNGESICFDEYNHIKNWDLLYGLMTAQPGTEYYFKPTNERIRIPETWRMYFTANIGQKYGGFEVADAFISRSGGKKMEMNFPPVAEEITVALAELCDTEGTFLVEKEEIAKMAILVKKLFPEIRALIGSQQGTSPISWRTIRDIGEKLILTTKDKYGKTIRTRNKETNFDDAVYEVLVEAYVDLKNKSAPKEIVNLCTNKGLFLTDSLMEEICNKKKWLPADEFIKRKGVYQDFDKEIEEIIKTLRGERTAAYETGSRPERIVK